MLLTAIGKQMDASRDNCHCEYSERIPVCAWIICIHGSSVQHCRALFFLHWVEWQAGSLRGHTTVFIHLVFNAWVSVTSNISSKSDGDLCSLFPIWESVSCSIPSIVLLIYNMRNHWIAAVVHSQSCCSEEKHNHGSAVYWLLIMNSHVSNLFF